MRRASGIEAARKLLQRPDPLDALRGHPGLLASIEATFGESLSPSEVVNRIIADVRHRGDEAVRDYTRTITGVDLPDLEVRRSEIDAARASVEPALVEALELAASRIRAYHEACAIRTGTQVIDRELGRRVIPLHRVGLYVPGGRYAYPSSVLMSAIPARAAGVEEVCVATPSDSSGRVSAVTLCACGIAGVDRVFRIGGAQAVAAMAYGTLTVPQVDKICGPGNIFVTLAKKQVFGTVAIDSLAGPSEVLIIADETASPEYCAADILAQAEHDPEAGVVLVTTSVLLADRVGEELNRQLEALDQPGGLCETVNRGVIAIVDSLDEAVQLSNEYAPEHLEVMVTDPRDCLEGIRNAGCICLGGESPVVMGDYIDGPSHVLPTGGSARFSSVLGIEDFVKYSSVAQLDSATMARLGPAAVVIARAEGLEAHARAVEKRLRRVA